MVTRTSIEGYQFVKVFPIMRQYVAAAYINCYGCRRSLPPPDGAISPAWTDPQADLYSFLSMTTEPQCGVVNP